ncbi:MAG: iron ABC transporter permease [Candidatus Contendobacter sp.]|nr:iron ABC transporter permease [Candidatus Contendobacter sp.]
MGLAALLLLVAVLALGIGAIAITPGQSLAIIGSSFGVTLPWEFTAQQQAVLLSIRAPRIVLGILVGAGLASSGAALQGLFRNPLADPGLIGVSSGAALAAVAVIVLGLPAMAATSGGLAIYVLPLAAFGGGLLATLLVAALAHHDGRAQVGAVLLAGIAINALAGAGTGLLTTLADDEQLRTLTFWSLGSLGGATWREAAATAPPILLALALIARCARTLNALLLGDREAGHLGFAVERTKRILMMAAALAVGSAVAVAGMIGFVGLVVPHLLRLVQGPDHRFLLPGSALLGAALLVCADLLARTLAVPAELPIGIVTALLGGPFFFGLLWRQRRQGEW